MGVRWAGRMVFPLLAGILAVGLLAMACTKEEKAAAPVPAAPEPPVSEVAAGVGLETVAGMAFTPRNITIPLGSTVNFTVASHQEHTVTFFVEGAPLPAGSARTWAATVKPGDTTQFDGTALVHSGIMEKGQKVGVTFPKAGTYKLNCPIHDRMDGTVTVAAAGQPYTTVSQAAAAAKQEAEAILALVEPMGKVASALATKTQQKDGTTLWTVIVSPRSQISGGYLEYKSYFPKDVKIKAGDTVRWDWLTGHSVTFLAPGQAFPTNAPQLPAAKPSPEYDGKSLYHSGILGPGRPAGASFELKFPKAGIFKYVCVLHWERMGQEGQVIVE